MLDARKCGKSGIPAQVRRLDESGLTVQERAASALAARQYVGSPAPRGVSEDQWGLDCAERDAFDAEHARLFVRLHDRFATLYARAYGRRYERTLQADWIDLRNLVLRNSAFNAPLLPARAFAEPLLVAAGIDCIGFVGCWAHQLQREPVNGTRIQRAYRATLEAAVREHDVLVRGAVA